MEKSFVFLSGEGQFLGGMPGRARPSLYRQVLDFFGHVLGGELENGWSRNDQRTKEIPSLPDGRRCTETSVGEKGEAWCFIKAKVMGRW